MRFNFFDHKPFFYSSLFFAVLLLFTILIKLAFGWNAPTAGAPNPAGQILYSDSSNNVGVGTLYPGAKLEIFSTSSDSIIKLSRGPGSSTSTIFKLGTDTAFIINNQSTDVLTIKSGNVGIGTTAFPVDAGGLTITGHAASSPNKYFIDLTRTDQIEAGGGIRWRGNNNSILFQIAGQGAGTPGIYFKEGTSDSMVIRSGGNVGIGTATPAWKLDVVGGSMRADGYVAGGQLCMGYATPDCRSSWASAGAIPAGAVMYFNLSSCPSGWFEATSIRGRYIVGLPLGGTLAGVNGTALGNLEDRATGQHNHGVSDPGHGHTIESGGNTGSGPAAQWHVGDAGYHNDPTSNSVTGISIQNSGSVPNTNAPYIQFLVCQKS